MRIFIDITSDQGDSDYIPLKVQNLTAVESSNAITVEWDELEGYEITLYEVWKKVNSGEWLKLTEIPFDNYGMFIVDIEVEEGNTYYYRARAKNAEGKYTDWSNEDNVTFEGDEIIFNPPVISYEIIREGTEGIKISWIADPNNTVTPTRYEMDKWVNDVPNPSFQNLSPEDGSAVDSVVDFGNIYKYRFRGFHPDHGTTEWSNQLTVNYEDVPELLREYDFTYYSEVQEKPGGAYVYIPQAYRDNPVANFPIVVFAHGSDEKSNNNSGPNFTRLASAAGFTQYFRGTSNEIPCIVICPQVIGFNGNFDENIIDEVVDKVCSDLLPNLDPDKFIVSGWSSGGGGMWRYAYANALDRVAGVIPFATAIAVPTNVNADNWIERQIPTWIFHNNDDGTQSSGSHKAMGNKANSRVPVADWIRATIYEGSGHDAVTKTLNGNGGDVVSGFYPYKNAGNELYDWISDVYYGNI